MATYLQRKTFTVSRIQNSDVFTKSNLPATEQILVPSGPVTGIFHSTIPIRPEGESAMSVSTVNGLHATPSSLLILLCGANKEYGLHASNTKFLCKMMSKYTYNGVYNVTCALEHTTFCTEN
jgi:hypothetical protein